MTVQDFYIFIWSVIFGNIAIVVFVFIISVPISIVINIIKGYVLAIIKP